MKNEAELLIQLREKSPRAFNAFFSEYTYEMISYACELTRDYVAASEIVTHVWYRLLNEDFASVVPPFRQFLTMEVRKACEFTSQPA